ncbi:uncharacterized protein LOC111247254 isoform X5 [Varroa destructor]|uniref:C2 domain-containing protein n=1 Tax=Varroa destructor TaxID=109461 RepID=A0A7M7MDB8_VARDE|nr:uncharacterized protein LOC111247254 isoform X5 [Varroa destructor]XP_022653686.1 uncharacterized protein LOC111247254 isoform X5 [Varroa destructor]
MLCCCGHLKAELQRLRKRGALRPGLDPERSCARCLSPLGRVLNRGVQCPVCRKKVCKDCRLYDSGVLTSPSSGSTNTGSSSNNNSAHWICVLCQKQLELKATSGQWMQASPSSSSAGSLRGAALGAGGSALPCGVGSGGSGGGGSKEAGNYRRRFPQSGSPPVVVSPILSAPNSVPATPQHGSRLPPGATVLPTPVLPSQLQAAASNPEHIPRKFLAAQAYYKLQQQQQQTNGGNLAVSDNFQHNDNKSDTYNNDCKNKPRNHNWGSVNKSVADGGAAGTASERDGATTTTAPPVDVVVYDDVSLPPRTPSLPSIGLPCSADLSDHHHQTQYCNLNNQSNYHLINTQSKVDVPSAPLKFGPGFDSSPQRQTPPPSRSHSPQTPHRRSPAPRSSSTHLSSPSTSPSPSLNGVPRRCTPINKHTKGSTSAKTSSLSTLSSETSSIASSGGKEPSTPHHLLVGTASATNSQQTEHNSLNHSCSTTALKRSPVLPAKPKRLDERSVSSATSGTSSNNKAVSVRNKGRLTSEPHFSGPGRVILGSTLSGTGNQSPSSSIGLSSPGVTATSAGICGAAGPIQQQPVSAQSVPLSWRSQRENASNSLEIVDSHLGSLSPQPGQASTLHQQSRQFRPHSSPAVGHGPSGSSGDGRVDVDLGQAVTGQRASSPTNSDSSSKNDVSVIFRRVTIKKKAESNSSTGSSDTQAYKTISATQGGAGPRGEQSADPYYQTVIGPRAPLETDHPSALAIDPPKCLPLSNRYPDLLTSSNLVQFEDDLGSSTSTLHSAADMESNCSASPMIRRLQAHIRARASFRMACAAPLSCSSEDDRDATLTRETTPPPQLGASQEKILPEDYQLVFITSSESFSDLSDYDEQGRKKRRKKKKRSTLKVKSRLEIGSGAYYIEDSEWEFTSDSDYRMAASLCSLDEISDVEENIREKAKIIEQKSASLEDLPSLFTRTGSVRLKRNNSVCRSTRRSMRLKNSPLLTKQERADDNGTNAVVMRECHKCGGVRSRASVLKTAYGPPAATTASSTGTFVFTATPAVSSVESALENITTHPDGSKDVHCRQRQQDDIARPFDVDLDLVQDRLLQQQSPSTDAMSRPTTVVAGNADAAVTADDTLEIQQLSRCDHGSLLTDTATINTVDSRILREALDFATDTETAGSARLRLATIRAEQQQRQHYNAGGNDLTILANVSNVNGNSKISSSEIDTTSNKAADAVSGIGCSMCGNNARTLVTNKQHRSSSSESIVVSAAGDRDRAGPAVLIASTQACPQTSGDLGEAVSISSDSAITITANGNDHSSHSRNDEDGTFASQSSTETTAAAATTSTSTAFGSYNAPVIVGSGHSLCNSHPSESFSQSCQPSVSESISSNSGPLALQKSSGRQSVTDVRKVIVITQRQFCPIAVFDSNCNTSVNDSGFQENTNVTSGSQLSTAETARDAELLAGSSLPLLSSADRLQQKRSVPSSAEDLAKTEQAESTAAGCSRKRRSANHNGEGDADSGGNRIDNDNGKGHRCSSDRGVIPSQPAMVLLGTALANCAEAAAGARGGGRGEGSLAAAHRSSPAGVCLTRAPWPDPRLALSVAADCGEVRFLPAGYERCLPTTTTSSACVFDNNHTVCAKSVVGDGAIIFAAARGDRPQQQQQKKDRCSKVSSLAVAHRWCIESPSNCATVLNSSGVDNYICESEDYCGLSTTAVRANGNNSDDDFRAPTPPATVATVTTDLDNYNSQTHQQRQNNINNNNREQLFQHREIGGAIVDIVERNVNQLQQQPQGIHKYFPPRDALYETPRGVVTSLEKYFTEELLIPQQNFDCFDDYDSDQEPPVPPAQGYLIEEEILSDVSSSSDDLLALQPGQQPVQQQLQQLAMQAGATMYGNPHAFSLHTIVEDSCEESEHSAPSSPQVQRQSSELEQYFSYAINNVTEDEQKRWSVVSEDLSDTVSEASYVSEVTEEDPSLLASSRLEKYFNNLVGGCPDTLSLKDELLIEEDTLQSGCFEEDTYNTIKRNKKTSKECSPSKEIGEQDDLDSSREDGDVTVIEVTACPERTLLPNPLAEATFAAKSPVEMTDDVLKCELSKGGKAKEDSSEDDQVAKMDIDDDEEEEDEADMAKIVDVVEKTPSPEHLDEIDNLQKPLKAIRLAEQLENIAIKGKMKHNDAQINTGEMKASVKDRVTKMNNAYVEHKNAVNNQPKIWPRCSPRKSSPDTGKKVSFKNEDVPDEEVAYVVNRVIAHISGSPDVDRPTEKANTPGWKSLLEDHITSLMQRVSPCNNNADSTVTSSNNSDYGSDTLESEEYPTEEDNNKKNKEASDKEALSDETLFICRKLMTSLKQLSSKSPSPPVVTEYAKAQEYIQDQIVALMHTVTASRNGSPTLNLKERKKLQGSPNLSEKQSESGSETVSASISIPSYDSDETSATEPVNNQEMEELYNMLSDNVSLSKLSCCDGETDHKTMTTVSAPVPMPRTKTPPKCELSPLQAIRISSPSAKYDSTSTLTTGSDTDFAGSMETVLEVKATSDAISPELGPELDSADMSRSESSLYVKAKKLSNRGTDHLNNKLAKSKIASKSECSIVETKDDDAITGKSVSEHNLFATPSENEKSPVNPSQSEDNILDTQRSRDTGYYSFKSSDESVEQQNASSPQVTEQTSEPVRPARSARQTGGKQASPLPTVQHALSTPNIHEAFANGKFSTLPLKPKRMEVPPEAVSMTLKPNKEKHFSSSFFSTSAVLRKLTLKADEASEPGGSPGLRSARFRVRGGRGSDADSASSSDNLHKLGGFSKSHTSLSTLGSTTTVNHPGGRSESMTSVYSAAGGGRYGAVSVTGEVNFGLSYDLQQGVLNVLIREAKNLAAVDEKRNRSDPYVKVYLLPDRSKSGKRKTKVRKHTLNPVFNEVLRFSVERTELTSRTLWLSVWHCDMFGRNDFLGEVMKDLSSDMLETNTSHWYPLQKRVDAIDDGSLGIGGGLGGPLGSAYRGDLMLSLKWALHDHRPGKGSLHVIVKEASNLQATRSNGTSDPFCKCYLLPDRHKSSKQKTAVARRSTTPVWNHPFVYHDVSLAELRERALELTIWDYDKITSNDFLGGVRLSLGTRKYQNSLVDWMDSQGEEIRLWRQMLDKPNQFEYPFAVSSGTTKKKERYEWVEKRSKDDDSLATATCGRCER